MDDTVRRLIYQPLVGGSLQAIIPELTIELIEGAISVPAGLGFSVGKGYVFRLFFSQGSIPKCLRDCPSRIMNKEDCVRISGLVDGELFFEAQVFPVGSRVIHYPGSGILELTSEQLHFVPETGDREISTEPTQDAGIYSGEDICRKSCFSSHSIFRGPELRLRDEGTRIEQTNDFLGKAVSSSCDTHVFSGKGWEAALIQIQDELHLHVRSQKSVATDVNDPLTLVDRVIAAVGFTHGFHPFPLYHEVSIDHCLKARWLSARRELSQSWLAPLGKQARMHSIDGQWREVTSIVPTIADGFRGIPPEKYDQIHTLLWHVLASDTADAPASIKLLIVCSALDGLMKTIGGDLDNSIKEWKKAAENVGIPWEGWMSTLMEIRKKHRDSLAHGRFWEFGSESDDSFFTDYPRLGCAFMAIIAAYCGYEGPISANPIGGAVGRISKLKADLSC